MADTIKLRRILNQACLDGTPCLEVKCYGEVACVSAGSKNNWWTVFGYIPCFASSHNDVGFPIHPQDPMK